MLVTQFMKKEKLGFLIGQSIYRKRVANFSLMAMGSQRQGVHIGDNRFARQARRG